MCSSPVHWRNFHFISHGLIPWQHKLKSLPTTIYLSESNNLALFLCTSCRTNWNRHYMTSPNSICTIEFLLRIQLCFSPTNASSSSPCLHTCIVNIIIYLLWSFADIPFHAWTFISTGFLACSNYFSAICVSYVIWTAPWRCCATGFVDGGFISHQQIRSIFLTWIYFTITKLNSFDLRPFF